MTPTMIWAAVGIILLVIVIYFFMKKPWTILSGLLRNLLIGGSVLLLSNYLGKTAGLHIPVNAGTVGVTAVLGWPGVVAIAAIQKWVL